MFSTHVVSHWGSVLSDTFCGSRSVPAPLGGKGMRQSQLLKARTAWPDLLPRTRQGERVGCGGGLGVANSTDFQAWESRVTAVLVIMELKGGR